MRRAIGAVFWGLAVGGVFAVLLLAARIITQVDFKADLGTPSARSQGETPVIEVQALAQTSPSQGESADGSSSSSSPVASSSEAPLASSTSGRFRVISSQPLSDIGTVDPSVPTEPTSTPPTSPTALAPSGTQTASDTKHAKKDKGAKSKGKAKDHGHKSGDKKQGKGSGKAHQGGGKAHQGGSGIAVTAASSGGKTHKAAGNNGHKGGNGKAHKGGGAKKHSGKHGK